MAGLVAGTLVPEGAQAQHPTAVTSIVNSNADTTLEVNYSGGLLAPGRFADPDDYSAPNDSIPAEGAGTRLMWYPEKGAFRAGQVGNLSGKEDVWDADSIGTNSVAFGADSRASGRSAIATGSRTQATGIAASAMGSRSTASAANATAIGKNTRASGREAVALGNNTTASGESATAMGNFTTASASSATAMGNNTTASAISATSMGEFTVADTRASTTLGVCNSSNTSTDGSLLVAGNGTLSGGCDSRSDALVLDQSGNLSIEGVFEADPANGTYAGHFRGSKSGSAGDPSNHIAFVENTGGLNSDGLAIKAGPNDSPGNAVNYLTFFDGDGDPIGAIEGDGSGGITQTSGSGDFAEELPVAEGSRAPEPADIVGVQGGKASLNTEDADRVMIASRAPILKGNATPATEKDDDRRVAVAFIGQVPVKIRGEAEPGDLVVPSGKEDGTARAVSPSDYRKGKHGPIAGQAWGRKESAEVGEVTVAVGLGQSGAVANQLQEQQAQIDSLKRRVQQIEDVKERLAQMEARSSRSGGSLLAGGAGPAGGVLVGLFLGGILALGLLWRRRG